MRFKAHAILKDFGESRRGPRKGCINDKAGSRKTGLSFCMEVKMLAPFSSCRTIIAQVTVIVAGDIKLDLILAAAVFWIFVRTKR